MFNIGTTVIDNRSLIGFGVSFRGINSYLSFKKAHSQKPLAVEAKLRRIELIPLVQLN